jgi:exopolysaccharide production protein ExoZ
MSPRFSATFAKVADYGFAMDRERYEGIQIARALAALGVCYFHSWGALDRFPKGTAHPIPWLAEYGWLGVDLFFAVSGFVICMVVRRSDFDPRSFLIRRVFRLYPLWLLMLTLFAVMAWQWRGLLPTETAGNFIYSATLLPTENFPFYDIGWSLQHETMFYLLVVVVVPFFGVMGLIAALCASIAANHLFSLPWYVSHLAFYHAEFLAGILAYLAMPYMRRFGALAPLAVGAIGLYYFLFYWGGRSFFPIPLFFLIAGFAMLRLPENPVSTAFLTLGDASYSIYLIHPLFFALVRGATITFYDVSPLWVEEPIRFGSIACVLVISTLNRRLFEGPMIKLGSLIASRRAGIGRAIVQAPEIAAGADQPLAVPYSGGHTRALR